MSLDLLTNDDWSIIRAVPSRSWPGVASLEIAQLWLYHGNWSGEYSLNESNVSGISPYLTVPNTVTGNPYRLAANSGRASKGVDTYGTGFVLDASEKVALLSTHPDCDAVIVPYINGAELNSIPDQTPCKWVIHFQSWPLSRSTAPSHYKGPVASDYPAALRILEERVKPERATKAKDVAAAPWWQFWRVRSELASATRDLSHVLARSRVANLHSLALLPKSVCCSDAVVVFAFEDYGTFALLQSSFHIVWLEFYASSMRTDVRYTATDCFDTFPFPTALLLCATVGNAYYQHRREVMVHRNEGLTKTYNHFHDPDETSDDIQRLRNLHIEMDQAVAAAYGWTDLDLDHGFHETKQGLRFTISEPARREVLQRLLKLNHERYAEEVKQGLHGKKRGVGRVVGGGKSKAAAGDAESVVAATKRRAGKKPAKSKDSDAQTVAEERSLFRMEDDES